MLILAQVIKIKEGKEEISIKNENLFIVIHSEENRKEKMNI